MSINISILGVCTSRDIFGISDTTQKYTVDAFVQSCNPISAVSPSPLIKDDDNGFKTVFDGWSDFYIRCAKQDIKKEVFSYFEKKKSEWLIIDFASLRKDLLITDKGICTELIPHKARNLYEEGFIGSYKVLNANSISRIKLLEYIDSYLERLLNIYQEKNIIVIDILGVDYCVNKQTKLIKYFDEQEVKTVNPLSHEIYEYTKERLPNCHYIPFPEEMIGDANHKWGANKLHFLKEYYDYAYCCIDTITSKNYSKREEEFIFNEAKNNCNKDIKDNYREFFRSTIKKLGYEASVSKKLRRYDEYFRELLLSDGQNKIIEYINEHNIHTCSIWGFTELCKYFVELLQSNGVQIKYIVQKINIHEYKSIPIIDPEQTHFTETDCMIIADLAVDNVKKQLQEIKYTNLIVDYRELASI